MSVKVLLMIDPKSYNFDVPLASEHNITRYFFD